MEKTLDESLDEDLCILPSHGISTRGQELSLNAVHLFKKRNRDKPGNFRPVSLTLLEIVLRDMIYSNF